ARVVSGRQITRADRPAFPLHDYFSAAQTRRVRRESKLEWMKAERNYPRARERAEMLPIVDLADANVAGRFVDINFRISRRDFSPLWICALGRDKIGKVRHGIEQANSGVGCEIGGEETEMEIRSSEHRARERATERFFVGTTPKHAMMQHRDRRMELGEDPSIIAASDGVR